MTTPGRSAEADDPGAPAAARGGTDGPGPPQGDLGLRAAFGRLAPQGSAEWNFSGIFTRLEQRYIERGAPATSASGLVLPQPPPPEPAGAPPPAADGHRSLYERALDRFVLRRVDERAARAAARVNELERARSDAERAESEDGFAAVVEALRFLAARVEVLEQTSRGRLHPVAGTAWLVPVADPGAWAGPVAAWVAEALAQADPDGAAPGGGPAGRPVLHAECGSGALLGALSAAGVEAIGVEPRPPLALEAAERGHQVEAGDPVRFLSAQPAGALGGLVLSGVVERVSLPELLGLLDTAVDRLAPGAPVVVLGSAPDVARRGWGAVALDLLPGRPLHPETWHLLLEQAGFEGTGRLEGAAAPEAAPPPGPPPADVAPAAFAVVGRKPR